MILEWYVGFHAPVRAWSWTVFGHVEAWGYTRDATWLFFDPQAIGTKIYVTHHADEVDELMARRMEACATIYKLAPPQTKIRLPFHPTMNCVTQTAHLLGLRAYSPWGFRRILLAHGAKELVYELADIAGRPPDQAGA